MWSDCCTHTLKLLVVVSKVLFWGTKCDGALKASKSRGRIWVVPVWTQTGESDWLIFGY